MPGPLLHASVWDAARGEHLVVVYRDAAKAAWGKRVHIERFITNKTYPLIKEGSVGIEFLSTKRNPGILQLRMAPVKRQKVKAVTVDLGKIPACGLAARGVKLTQKAVEKAELLPEGAAAPREKPSPSAAAPQKPKQPVRKQARGGPARTVGGGLLRKASHMAAPGTARKKGKK